VTKQEWYADEGNLTVLRQLIDNPVFQRAKALILRANRPTAVSLTPGVTGQDIMQENALRHSYHAAVFDVLDQFEILTNFPKQAGENLNPQQAWKLPASNNQPQ